MIRARRLALAVAAAGVTLAAPPAPGSASPGVYRVRPGPGTCPGPACGGFRASLVNRSSTVCLDGRARETCQAASLDLSALPAAVRAKARAGAAAGTALVEGAFAPSRTGPSPRQARLVATAVWLRAGTGSAGGTVYRVVDNGVRCFRAPCFSLRAGIVNRARAVTLSGLELGGTGAPETVLSRARAALSRTGVLAAGAVRAGRDGEGRELAATSLWLRL